MKTALVTGASRGIGRAVAVELATRGYEHIMLHYHQQRAAAETVSEEIQELGVKATLLQANLGDPDAIDTLTETVLGATTELHALVHAAAINTFKPLHKVRPSQWDLCMNVSTRSFVQLVELLMPALKLGSSVVALSSMGSERALEHYGPMGPAKAALEAAVRQLAFELGPQGIRVNTISAGLVRTTSLDHFPQRDAMIAYAERVTPLRRIAEPHDIALAVHFLLSDDARWITGQSIVADGGYSIA